MADPANGIGATARELFGKKIKGLPVKEILAEERLDIQHEYDTSRSRLTVPASNR